MNSQRIIGVVLAIIGIALLIVGMSSSHSKSPDQVSNTLRRVDSPRPPRGTSSAASAQACSGS